MSATSTNTRKQFAATRTAELLARGIPAEVVAKMVRKQLRMMHPLHKQAIARRADAADVALTITNQFHSL